MTHQHGGRPGSMNHAYVSAQASRGIDARTGLTFDGHTVSKGGGGSDDSGDCYGSETPTKEIKGKEGLSEKIILPKPFHEKWGLYVDGSEWDLSDIVSIEKPCKDYCYFILEKQDGKKIRISGNVVLEEL